MTDNAPEPQPRSLFLNGEGLRQNIGRPGGGGGEKFKPFTVEENAHRIATQLSALRTAAAVVPEARRGDQLVVEAQLHPQFLAASSFPAALFQRIGVTPVGTRVGRSETPNKKGESDPNQPTKTVYLATEPDSLDRLFEIVSQPTSAGVTKQVREDIQALDQVTLNAPRVLTEDVDGILTDRPTPDGQLWEAVLHGRVGPGGRVLPASPEAVSRWAEFVASIGGEVERDWVRDTESLTFAPARLPASELDRTTAFNGLRAIHPMPTPRHLPSAEILGTAFPPPTSITSQPATNAPLRVAVFDGGVDEGQAVWAGKVRTITVGNLQADVYAQRHGALVTSALLYGNADAAALPAPANVNVDHYAVVPQTGPISDLQMYWLLDIIQDQVTGGNYDVVALCVAPDQIVDDDHVDRWTSTIDTLSHRENVLFVVAAGNNGEQPAGPQLNRILVPADATNALAVGAATRLMPKAKRAAYSAVGPGRPVAQVRPTGVAFGGTDTDPFFATDNDGAKLASQGTSCATPFTVHGLADLNDRVGHDNIDPVTLRAFAIHFAHPCARGENPNTVGYGHFRTHYDVVTSCLPQQAHVLYRGTIDRDEFIPLAIPMPNDIPGRVRLRYTLVTSTQVAESDPIDYTKSGLEVTLRPHSRIFNFSKNGKSRKLNLLTDSAQASALMQDGYVPSGEPVTLSLDSRPRTEAVLRAEGKWDSVRVGERRFQKDGSLYEPRIELSHLARDQGVLVGDVPALDWALLVTLEAQAGVDLHEAVRLGYPVLSTLTVPATVTVAARR